MARENRDTVFKKVRKDWVLGTFVVILFCFTAGVLAVLLKLHRLTRG